MKTIKFLSILLLMTMAFSCNKDDGNEPEPLTAQELLLGTWFIESHPAFSTPATDCEKSSYLDFVDEDTVITELFLTDGSTSDCNSNGLFSGPYTFSEATETITIIDGSSTTELEVIVLTENRLVVSTDLSGSSITISCRK